MPSHADAFSPRLRLSMRVGAVYDALLGLGIVLALEPLSRVLPIPYPEEPFYARVQGVLLLGLAIFYGFAALDLARNLRNVAGAVAIRALGGLYIVGYAALADIPPFFFVFGGVDLLFAVWHLVLLRTETRVDYWPLLLRGEGSPKTAALT